jgi:hypothetical protein
MQTVVLESLRTLGVAMFLDLEGERELELEKSRRWSS